MTTTEILDTVSAAGGQLWLVEGDNIRARLPEKLRPLVDLIRERKPELVELLAARPMMPSGVRLVNYALATPPVKLSQCETVVDTERFVQATLRQVDARLHNKNFLAGSWPLSELLMWLAAVGCHVTLENRNMMLQ